MEDSLFGKLESAGLEDLIDLSASYVNCGYFRIPSRLAEGWVYVPDVFCDIPAEDNEPELIQSEKALRRLILENLEMAVDEKTIARDIEKGFFPGLRQLTED